MFQKESIISRITPLFTLNNLFISTQNKKTARPEVIRPNLKANVVCHLEDMHNVKDYTGFDLEINSLAAACVFCSF